VKGFRSNIGPATSLHTKVRKDVFPKMRYLIRLLLLSTPLLLMTSAVANASHQDGGTNISFTVSMSKPHTHLLEVEMRIIESGATAVSEDVLVMPVWTPGSYLIREFERHVQNFSAVDGSGRALPWEKTNKNSWRIRTNNAREIRVKYLVYANELTVRTNELNSDHAFWNNAALLMYLERSLTHAVKIHVNPAPGWKVATGLPPVPGEKNTFEAGNFDILYDSPFEVSDFKQIDFVVRGVPHRIVIDGEGNYDATLMRAVVQKIVEAEVALFGDIPYHDYTFFLHLRPTGGGGLEHLNSTGLGFRRFGFSDVNGYRRFGALVAHEFFHLWNVKRIRPDALGPFDYTKENHTKLLWVAEGVTEYYGQLMLRRAGLISDEAYLAHLASQIQDVQDTPGRKLMSAEDASFNSWIKEYRPDENSINSQISYYDKGELLGLLLDLEIRRRSNNAKSLDDVMRTLYTDFFKRNRNYTPADFQKVCEAAAASSLDDFFARYVRGLDELPYNQVLSAAGLELQQAGVPIEQVNNVGDIIRSPYLGVEFEDSAGFVSVKNVRAGSPAYEQGLNAKDLIIAIDGERADTKRLIALLGSKKPGEVIRLTVFRNDDVRTLDIKLGSRIAADYELVQLPARSEQQKRIYDSWMRQVSLP
jgi:predicted metalloprotease with PDZ domain